MAAKDYKIFDGTNWVSPCDQEVRILMPDGVTWQLLDPVNNEIKYFDGTTWKPMLCIDPPPPAVPINCSQGSLSGSGGSGIYYIPMTLEANVCDISVTLDVSSIPDSITILSADKSTILAQSGYFGSSSNPSPGSYNFGLFKPRKIFSYDPTVPSNFSINPLAPNETLTVLSNQFPITNTNPLNIPNSKDPANQTQTVRTITWTKGVTPTDVNILIRVVGHPDSGTAWSISAIACANCPPPSPPPPPALPCPNCSPGVVTIGSQIWAKCNANISKYRDGTDIPQITDQTQWQNATTGAWCYYNNDPLTAPIYGKLYNWWAIAGIQNAASATNPALRKEFAPVNYHVPTDAEWTTLVNNLGGETIAGGKLKEVGTCHWIAPNNLATDSSGFTGLPAGYRYHSGFAEQGLYANWWTKTESDFYDAYLWSLQNIVGSAGRSSNYKAYGLSVRFIKD